MYIYIYIYYIYIYMRGGDGTGKSGVAIGFQIAGQVHWAAKAANVTALDAMTRGNRGLLSVAREPSPRKSPSPDVRVGDKKIGASCHEVFFAGGDVAGLLGCWVAGLLGCWVAGLLGCWVFQGPRKKFLSPPVFAKGVLFFRLKVWVFP